MHGHSGKRTGGIDEDMVAASLGTVLDHYNISVGRGTEAPIRCPAHDDAHASASANLSKGVWFCHACGAGGNALHVIMAQESCDLATALDKLQVQVGDSYVPETPRRITPRRSGSKGKGKWTPPRLRSA